MAASFAKKYLVEKRRKKDDDDDWWWWFYFAHGDNGTEFLYRFFYIVSNSLCDHSCAGIDETFFKGIDPLSVRMDDDDVDDDCICFSHVLQFFIN
jgi:hypothetical protein